MQKVWKQIGFGTTELRFFHEFIEYNECKNETEGMKLLIEQFINYKRIVHNLENISNRKEKEKEEIETKYKQRLEGLTNVKKD